MSSESTHVLPPTHQSQPKIPIMSDDEEFSFDLVFEDEGDDEKYAAAGYDGGYDSDSSSWETISTYGDSGNT